LNLQLRNIHNKDEESVRKAFIESRDRIYSMALVHQLLYQSDDLSKVNLKEYVEQLISKLLSIQSNEKGFISTNIQIEPLPLTISQAIPCGLIINELVLNIFEHAFPPGFDKCKSMDLMIKKNESNIVSLMIQDSGVGFQMKSDNQDFNTFGLKLVKSLAINQLEGTIDVSVNGGTKFIINFKLDGEHAPAKKQDIQNSSALE